MQYHLFISYASQDRNWAKRLHDDIKTRYPALNIFWDYEALKAGQAWQDQLEKALQESAFFAVLWSEAAKDSDWVGPEIEKFMAASSSKVGGPEGRVFYIPLEGRRGNLEKLQAFPAIRNSGLYSSGAASIDADPPTATEWNRIVARIGQAVLEGDPAELLPVGVLALTQAQYSEAVTGFAGMPRLGDALTEIQMDPASFGTPRYFGNGLQWRPFGTPETIVEILMQAVDQVNEGIAPRRIRPDILDLTRFDPFSPPQMKEVQNKAAIFAGRLSLIVIDPFTLYHITTQKLFQLLKPCLESEKSFVVFLSPEGRPGADVLAEKIRILASPALDPYFDPPVPRSRFAQCAVNVRYPYEIRRLIRVGLGMVAPPAHAVATEFIQNRI